MIPASDITCKGSNLVYYQAEEGAVIYNKETKEAHECIPEGKCFRMPVSSDKKVNGLAVHAAEVQVAAEREKRNGEIMRQHAQNLHKPKPPMGICAVCDEVEVIVNKQRKPELVASPSDSSGLC